MMLKKRKIKQLTHCPAGRDFRVWALKETSTGLVFRDRSILLRICLKEANSLIGESDLKHKQKFKQQPKAQILIIQGEKMVKRK